MINNIWHCIRLYHDDWLGIRSSFKTIKRTVSRVVPREERCEASASCTRPSPTLYRDIRVSREGRKPGVTIHVGERRGILKHRSLKFPPFGKWLKFEMNDNSSWKASKKLAVLEPAYEVCTQSVWLKNNSEEAIIWDIVKEKEFLSLVELAFWAAIYATDC